MNYLKTRKKIIDLFPAIDCFYEVFAGKENMVQHFPHSHQYILNIPSTSEYFDCIELFWQNDGLLRMIEKNTLQVSNFDLSDLCTMICDNKSNSLVYLDLLDNNCMSVELECSLELLDKMDHVITMCYTDDPIVTEFQTAYTVDLTKDENFVSQIEYENNRRIKPKKRFLVASRRFI